MYTPSIYGIYELKRQTFTDESVYKFKIKIINNMVVCDTKLSYCYHDIAIKPEVDFSITSKVYHLSFTILSFIWQHSETEHLFWNRTIVYLLSS